MNVPTLVQSSLGDEDVAAHVPLKGENALFVTPTRTVVYTADGLLSDETTDEYPHDAEGLDVSDGRRKAKITLDYGLDGDQSFSVPSGKLDDVLHPVLAGVLNAADVTGPGETVKRTYRFSELTLVATSDRVVKHVGEAVWGPDYEEIAFEEVTGIGVEEGSVASQLVLETPGRTERIKAPSEQFRDVRETVEDAVYAFHDAANAAEFERMNVDERDDDSTEEVSFGGGVDPIDTSGVGEDDEADAAGEPATEASGASTASVRESASESTTGEPATGEPTADSGGSDEFASSGFQNATEKVEPPVDPDELDAELDELEAAIVDLAETVDSQQAVVERQQAVIDAQQTVLAEQRDRLDALRELTRDQ